LYGCDKVFANFTAQKAETERLALLIFPHWVPPVATTISSRRADFRLTLILQRKLRFGPIAHSRVRWWQTVVWPCLKQQEAGIIVA
jgi:hypothetical protein